MEQVFHSDSNLSEEEISTIVQEIVLLRERHHAYKAELESIDRAIVTKTLELGKHIAEPAVVICKGAAVPIDVEKNNKRVIVGKPLYCINL
jgi:methyl coenzyme M reductase subunit C